MTAHFSLALKVSAAGTAGNDVFNVRASALEGAVFREGAGTDTPNLVGGGVFVLPSATLSSIETVRGTSQRDTIFLDARTLMGLRTLIGEEGAMFSSSWGTRPRLTISGKDDQQRLPHRGHVEDLQRDVQQQGGGHAGLGERQPE